MEEKEEKGERESERTTIQRLHEMLEEKGIMERYMAGESIESLSSDLGVHRATLYRWLGRLKAPRRYKDVSAAVAAEAQEKIVEKAKEDMSTAIGIGQAILGEHYDWLNYMRSKGMSLREIASELVEWYIRKEETLSRMADMERELKELMKERDMLAVYTAPNIRFHLKTNTLEWLWTKLLKAKLVGVELNTALLIDRFKRMLDVIDRSTPRELTDEAKKWTMPIKEEWPGSP